MGYFQGMADHHDTAHRIYEAATSAGAGRVALRDDGKYTLADAEEAEIAEALRNTTPQYFKLQAREAGRWVDISRLQPVGTGPSALSGIRSRGVTEASKLTDSELGKLAADNPGGLDKAIPGIANRLIDHLTKDSATPMAGDALAFMTRLSDVHQSPHAQYLHATVSLLDAVGSAVGSWSKMDEASIESAVDARIAEQQTVFNTPGGRVAAANMLGKVRSLEDRPAATEHFETVRREDSWGLIRDFYADMGARTYFAAPGAEDATLVREIQASIVPMDASSPTARTGLVVSVDPKFYRIYAPTMFFYAQQMPDVDFNIVLCGEEREAEEAIADGARYRTALAQLNRSGTPKNVHHFRVPVPEVAAEVKTFYASARFFAAPMMLERYPNIYQMDADLTTNADPRPFFKSVVKEPFAAPLSRGLAALSPWRRYIANNIPMSRAVLDSSLLDDLQAYLVHGMSMRGSWMLDQNALTYAIERSSGYFSDLSRFKRPFYGPPFRTVWEKSYRG